MKVFIVEDEKLGVERLEKQLKEIDDTIQVVGAAESIKSSVNWLQQNSHPDLILMDIELTDGQSFEIFRKIELDTPVIFTTSYDEYALEAFKVNSIDYLLKPVKIQDLRKGIEKFRKLKQQSGQNNSIDIERLVNELKQQQVKSVRNRFLVKQGQRLISIEVPEIAYFFVDGRLTFFKTWNKNKFVINYTLDDLANMLKPEDFYRINRSFIVHIKAIDQIHNHFHGKLKLELFPPIDKEILISRENALDFKEWMGK